MNKKYVVILTMLSVVSPALSAEQTHWWKLVRSERNVFETCTDQDTHNEFVLPPLGSSVISSGYWSVTKVPVSPAATLKEVRNTADENAIIEEDLFMGIPIVWVKWGRRTGGITFFRTLDDCQKIATIYRTDKDKDEKEVEKYR